MQYMRYCAAQVRRKCFMRVRDYNAVEPHIAVSVVRCVVWIERAQAVNQPMHGAAEIETIIFAARTNLRNEL